MLQGQENMKQRIKQVTKNSGGKIRATEMHMEYNTTEKLSYILSDTFL